MDKQKFLIIKFEELPHSEMDTFQCVPNQWVGDFYENGHVETHFPPIMEYPNVDDMAKNSKDPNPSWKMYPAIIVEGMSSYKEAEKILQVLRRSHSRDRQRIESVNMTSGKRPSYSEVDQMKRQKLKHVINQSNANLPSSPVTEINENQSTSLTSTVLEDVSSTHEYRITNVQDSSRFKHFMDAEIDENDDRPPSRAVSLISEDENLQSDNIEKNISDEIKNMFDQLNSKQSDLREKMFDEFHKKQSDLNVKMFNDLQKKQSELKDAIFEELNNTQSQLRDKMIEELQKMHSEFKDRFLNIYRQLRINSHLTPQCEIIEDENVREETNINPYDSKYSLRYQSPGQNISELLPNSGVFILDSKLKSSQRLSKDSTELARNLFDGIFDMHKARFLHFTQLDSNAKNTLIDFVENYCKEKNEKIDRQKILSSMKNVFSKWRKM